MKGKINQELIIWVVVCLLLVGMLIAMYSICVNRNSKVSTVEYDNTLINNTIQQEIEPLKERINILEEKINNL